ncbi:MAG: GNAT family N-acetyltransferase [Chloroflexota bacterium]
MITWEGLCSDAWIDRAMHSLGRGWECIALATGGRAEQWDGLMVADAASPNPFLNSATLTRPLLESEAGPLTARLEAFFAERPVGGPWLLWSGWPTPDLSGLGYVLWGHPPIMVRQPGGQAPPPPTELRIVEVTEAQELAALERTFVEAYPVLGIEHLLPGAVFAPGLLGGPFRFWAGYVDDEMVGVAAALVEHDHTDVAFIATQPHARKKGYGSALTWTATLADPSLPAVLEASDDGRPIYERMGYREVGRMSLWERPRDPANPVYSPYAPPRP